MNHEKVRRLHLAPKCSQKTLFDLDFAFFALFLSGCCLFFDSKRIYDAFAAMHYNTLSASGEKNHLRQKQFFSSTTHECSLPRYICRYDNDVLS